MARKNNHGVKYSLQNFECGECSTGVVQIFEQTSRSGVTTKVSGCLDCRHEYGINQAYQLKPYARKDTTYGY